jgi:hypothetical protein
MLNYVNSETRHWTPQQSYVTGDVLIAQVARGWQISRIERVTTGCARLYRCTLERTSESLTLDVLDGPAVRDFAARLASRPTLIA